MVQAGTLDYEPVVCSCPAGMQGTQVCNYGRDCGTLKVNGRDVVDAERLERVEIIGHYRSG